MSKATTYLLLAAAAATAVTIYMFDPSAKPTTHSQPKFTQMNQPGDKPYVTNYNSAIYKNLPVEDRLASFKGTVVSGPLVQGGSSTAAILARRLLAGKI